MANAAAQRLKSLHTCFTALRTVRSLTVFSRLCLCFAFTLAPQLCHHNRAHPFIHLTHHSRPFCSLFYLGCFLPFCSAHPPLVFGSRTARSARPTSCLGYFASSVLSLRPASQTRPTLFACNAYSFTYKRRGAQAIMGSYGAAITVVMASDCLQLSPDTSHLNTLALLVYFCSAHSPSVVPPHLHL